MLLKTKERREIISKLTSLDSAWNANTRYRDCNATQAQDAPFPFWFAAQLALKDPTCSCGCWWMPRSRSQLADAAGCRTLPKPCPSQPYLAAPQTLSTPYLSLTLAYRALAPDEWWMIGSATIAGRLVASRHQERLIASLASRECREPAGQHD